MSEVKQYAERDLMAMDIAGNHYCRHVSAMTREQLHSKSDIAAELGWRDMKIAELKAQRDALAAENAALKEFGDKLNDMHNNLNGEGTAIQGRAEVACQQVALEAAMDEFDAIKTPATDAYLNSVRAEVIKEFCQLAGQYGKVEPHHFNSDFADLYAKINKEIYESILDNAAVYDMESLVDWLESGVNDSRAYADMSIQHAAQIRAGEPS